MKIARVGFLVLMVWLIPFFPARAQSGLLPAYPDVPYVPDGDPTKHVLDIYLPEGEGPFPALMMIHCNGCSKWDYAPQAEVLAEKGYATVTIEYRDISRSAPLGPVQDSFCALAWLVDNGADYQIDPNRIAVFGHSLGGYPAAMIGTVDDPALFLDQCPSDLPEDYQVSGVIVYAGALQLVDSAPQAWRDLDMDLEQLTPTYWIDGTEPPFLILHGMNDTRIPIDVSEQFAAALEAAGDDVQFMRIPGAGHGIRIYQRVSSPEVDSVFESFLASVLPG
jgi:dipeptidyl aminopeptidase/acylaminoacyl peptidase